MAGSRVRPAVRLVIGAAVLAMAVAASVGGEESKRKVRSALIHSVDVLELIGRPVTNENWEQIARVERVLFDPASGRATFVVLSFVDRDGLVALPWARLAIDERGRARLTAGPGEIAEAPRFYRSRRIDRPSAEPPIPERAARVVASTGGTAGENVVQGTIVGRISLPGDHAGGSAGDRRVAVVVDVGGRTVRLDLGPEKFLEDAGVEIRPGDRLTAVGHFTPRQQGETFVASELYSGKSRWLELPTEPERRGEP